MLVSTPGGVNEWRPSTASEQALTPRSRSGGFPPNMNDGLPRPEGWKALASLALVVLLAGATLAWLHSATPSLYGYDGWFHIRYAEVLRSEGVSRSFPWWDETFLRDHYADKDFLYHVLLIPFTFGDLTTGARLAAILFGAAAIGVFHLSARALRVPWPAAWACALLACSTAFLYRLGFTRPSIMAVSLAIGGAAAILSGRARWAFAAAAVYPHVHISWHLLPCIALLHDLQRPLAAGERRSFRISRWSAAGALAGVVITPYFPNNLRLWWVQNVRVLGLAWSSSDDLGMGLEIRSGLASQLLTYNLGVFLALALAVYLIARKPGKASPEALTLLVVSGGFLVLSMMSRRFIEFWTPFTILLAAVALRDEVAARDRSRAGPLAAAWGGIATIVVGALFLHGTTAAREIIGRDPGPTYEEAAGWMASNIDPGEKIFHLDWDDFPQLFFFAPQFRYLVGLDPVFMYETDPARWRAWQSATHGEDQDLYTAVRGSFGSRWVFATHDGEEFLRLAQRDPRFFPRYEDLNVTVLFLADGFNFIDRWVTTGWYPNPSGGLFDGRLPGEPGEEGKEAAHVAVGPGASGAMAAFPSGFVDLARSLSVPSGLSGACAMASASVETGGGGVATVRVTTDDEFSLWVDGLLAGGHSPRLSPPAGTPGGPPVSLDDPWLLIRRVEERSFEVTLREGSSDLILKSCQSGEDFGFYLRVVTADGLNLRPPPPPA